MERRIKKDSKVMWVLKALLAAYIVTGILLLVLTVFMYKLEMSEKVISAAIVGVYLLSTLIGGLAWLISAFCF